MNLACLRNTRSFWFTRRCQERGMVEGMRLAGRQEPRHIRPCRPRKVDLYFTLKQGFFIVFVPRTSWAAC